MKTHFVLASIAFTAATWAADADFFPLAVGNQWVLQSASAEREMLNIEVLRSRVVDGQTYYLVSGFTAEERWLRKDADGSVYGRDERGGGEVLLLRPQFGASYQTPVSGCSQTANAASETTRYRGPNFEVEGSLVVQYSPDSCRDIGFTSEVYAPEVGLVKRSLVTFRGETVFNLIHARVNGSPLVAKSKEIVVVSDFNTGSKGWLPGFADYSLQNSDLRMEAELRPLPAEISASRSGYFIQSMNRSDDLFMFLKKQVAHEYGLEPNQQYRVSFDLRYASNAPTGCVGIGGSPGDSVYLKAGASVDEPVTLLTGASNVQLSIDKGQQSQGGKDAGIVGTIANGTDCVGNDHPYVRVTKTYAHPTAVKTDERGSLWLVIGTDSGYEGLTGLYLESITARINPAVEPAAGGTGAAASAR